MDANSKDTGCELAGMAFWTGMWMDFFRMAFVSFFGRKWGNREMGKLGCLFGLPSRAFGESAGDGRLQRTWNDSVGEPWIWYNLARISVPLTPKGTVATLNGRCSYCVPVPALYIVTSPSGFQPRCHHAEHECIISTGLQFRASRQPDKMPSLPRVFPRPHPRARGLAPPPIRVNIQKATQRTPRSQSLSIRPTSHALGPDRPLPVGLAYTHLPVQTRLFTRRAHARRPSARGKIQPSASAPA